MKRIGKNWARGSLVAAMVLAMVAALPVAQGSVIVTGSATAPTVDADDVYFLPADPIANGSNVGGVLYNNEINRISVAYIPGGIYKAPGQTFTTGSNAGGYSIDSVTLQSVVYTTNVGTYTGVANGCGFQFVFGSLNGTTKTQLFSTAAATYQGANYSQSGGAGLGIYFTFDLSNEALADLQPNTVYYFEIQNEGIAPNEPYFELMGASDANAYTGGTAYYATDASNYTAKTGDRAFAVGLTAIPEPASLGTFGAVVVALLLRRRFRG